MKNIIEKVSASLPVFMVQLFVVLVALVGPIHAEESDDSPFVAKTFKGLELRGIGPALMSGRIADIAIHPQRQSTWYVAVGSGNVWKTTNAGTTWTPIFDDQGSYSIGCVSLDPANPETVWVGTGENVGGRHVGYGDGVYKSRDGGATWTNMGLGQSEHIGMIAVDPRDSNVVYVAAQGPLWKGGGDRGLYKTTDGGAKWTKILGGGDYTGVNEVHLDPRRPDVVYATTHQRMRSVAALIDGGPESAIHKSTDGGATWTKLSEGLPEDDMGKIGLAISPVDADVVYATIELAHRKGGFYRSTNGGGTWEHRNDYVSGATGPHYYQEIFASPHKLDRVYQMDNRLWATEDGGENFNRVGEEFKHGDNHAMAFDPDDPNYLMVGSDGGLYESWDLGATWRFAANLPITQFYKVAVDDDEPFYNVYGGTQDNNSQGGPSRTNNIQGIRNSDWFITLFGDGHQPAVEPGNPDIVYSEWQQGNLVRYDRKNGEIVYIKPQPEPGDPPERWNWDSPILVSPHDPARLYFASQRLWRSDDRGDSWRAISGDLSRGRDRLVMPLMDRVWSYDAIWDLWAMSNYANITSVSESPLVEGLIYVGTDDGLVQVTADGGATWRRGGSLPGVPDEAFVNDIKADLHDADTVYVVLDDHKNGDFSSYVLRSRDRGKSWKSIAADLPDRHIVWRLVQDHVDPELFFVGTEFGVFFSPDAGGRWLELEGGVPNIPFRDLAIQRRENDLVGATFGRGFYVLDDYSPLRNLSEAVLESEAVLFAPRDAWWYVERRPLGRSDKATQGAAFFTAPNPPFGAVFTYYLGEKLTTREERRQESEKEAKEQGEDTPYPGWDELRKEHQEEEPAVMLTVRDADGEVVRRIRGPVEAGFHRVAWDLRRPSADALVSAEVLEEDDRRGYLVAPGAFTVELATRVDGILERRSEVESFDVVPLGEAALPGAEPAEVGTFLEELASLERTVTAVEATLDSVEERLAVIGVALRDAAVDGGDFDDRVRALGEELFALREMVSGRFLEDEIGEPVAPGIRQRMGVAVIGNSSSTYGPTPTHRRSLEIAMEELSELRVRLEKMMGEDLAGLERDLDAAGVVWTVGRRVP